MSVTAEPEVLNGREMMAEVQKLRRQADSIEQQLKKKLAAMMYQQVIVEPIEDFDVLKEVEQYGGFGGSTPFRHIGEGGWSSSFNQLRATPTAGLLVDFDIDEGRAYVVLADLHFRCEWSFNLRYFTIRANEAVES